MVAVVFRQEVILNRLAMLQMVHIRPYEIYHVVVDQVVGHLPDILAVVPGQTQQIDLEKRSGLMRLAVAFFPGEIIGITLGMGQNRLISAHLKFKQHLIEIPRFLDERILDKQVIVGHGIDKILLQLGVEESVHAVFRRMLQFNIHASLFNRLFQSGESGRNGFGGILESILRNRGGLQVGASFSVALTIVDTRNKMAMNVGMEKQFRPLRGLFPEKIKHFVLICL